MAESNENPIVLDRAEQRIKEYLDDFAKKDEVFSKKYQSTDEEIRNCRIYIEEQVKSSKRMMYDDDEIFGMAVHFFDECIKPSGNKPSAIIATTGFSDDQIKEEIEKLSDERKAQLRKAAENRFREAEEKRLKADKEVVKKNILLPKTDKPKDVRQKIDNKKPVRKEAMMLDLFAGLE